MLPTAGRQIVDGHTALQYVRARQVTTETNGDYGRIKRQQLFLSSLLRSLISKDTFFSLSKLNNVVKSVKSDDPPVGALVAMQPSLSSWAQTRCRSARA